MLSRRVESMGDQTKRLQTGHTPDQVRWSVARLLATTVVLVGAFAFANPRPAAGGAGTCVSFPNSDHKCISSAGNVYEDKYCAGSQCMTCVPDPDEICTGFGKDVGDYREGGGGAT